MEIKKAFKGLSPLVAVIVLIGITLIVAGIVATYTQQLTQRQFSTVAECSQGKVIIQGATYNDATDTLNLFVYNYGRINLTFNTLLTKLDGSVTKVTTTNFAPAGEITTFTIGSVANDLREATIQSAECQGAIQDLIPSTFIKGMGA